MTGIKNVPPEPTFFLVVVASVLFVSASYGQKLCYPDSNPKTTQAYFLSV